MVAIGASRAEQSAIREAGTSPGALDAQQDESPAGAGALHRLLNQPSALDRLVGDAGALGRFRTDMPDQMPSGTSALTLKVGDALNRLAARLGLPSERILSGNPSFHPEPIALPPTALPARAERVSHGTSPDAAKPVDLAGTDNRAGPVDRGNRHEAGA